MMEELVIINSMPLPLARLFWDGQPRDDGGRFDYGRMPGACVRISACAKSLPVDDYNGMIAALARLLDGPYAHPDCGEYRFSRKGLRHAVRTCPMREKMFALACADRIIAACDLHPEPPKDGNPGILKVWHGRCRVKVMKHVFTADVFLETAADGNTRFHHLSLTRSDMSKRLYEQKKAADSK